MAVPARPIVMAPRALSLLRLVEITAIAISGPSEPRSRRQHGRAADLTRTAEPQSRPSNPSRGL